MYCTTKNLELLDVASRCIYFFAAYETFIYEEMIADSTTKSNAELLEKFYSILVDQESEYHELVAYLEDEAHGNYFPLGAESLGSVTKEQCAGMLYLSIINIRPYLPKTYGVKSNGYPEDF